MFSLIVFGIAMVLIGILVVIISVTAGVISLISSALGVISTIAFALFGIWLVARVAKAITDEWRRTKNQK